MSLPLNDECPTCFGYTGMTARMMPKHRCTCPDEDVPEDQLTRCLGDPFLNKHRARALGIAAVCTALLDRQNERTIEILRGGSESPTSRSRQTNGNR